MDIPGTSVDQTVSRMQLRQPRPDKPTKEGLKVEKAKNRENRREDRRVRHIYGDGEPVSWAASEPSSKLGDTRVVRWSYSRRTVHRGKARRVLFNRPVLLRPLTGREVRGRITSEFLQFTEYNCTAVHTV